MPWTGVFAPVPTPFDAEDRVDPARMRGAFSRWLKSPLTGFVVLGSNGEAALLDEGESDLVVATARELVPRGRPLIVGTGRESTQAAVRAARRAADLGADAVLVRTPGFFKSQMTSAVFVRHYTEVADASPVPVLLYNFTAVTGVTLQPDAVAKLASHPNIAGMKESGGDIAQIAELLAVSSGQAFSVLAGSASTFYAALGAGVSGGILALSCVLPDACVRLFDLMAQKRHDEARALQRQLAPLARLLGSVYGVAGLKAALPLVGIDAGIPRPPLVPVPDAGLDALRQALATFQEAAV
jgi:4-hydroxy-2-oxoglutarate aldolase